MEPLAPRLAAAWRVLRGTPLARVGAPVPGTDTETVFRALVSALPQPTIVLDRAGTVLALNDAANALAPALMPGAPAVVGLRVPELIDAIRRAAATGEPQQAEFEQRSPRQRASRVIVTPMALPVAPAQRWGRVLWLTVEDLTPLRRSEDMRSDFVANASHELRTPLASLLGFIETLQGSARDDASARERFLDIMRTQAKRMARLIDDLLSLSRIELNAHRLPKDAVPLAPLLRQVADGLQTLARDRQVEVKLTMPNETLAVLGERDELVRAFENLLENALKYGCAGHRVDLALVQEATTDGAAEAQVIVRDYGPGIAPEHLPRLTERFYRVDVTDSRSKGGTGLGLALVKHILNRHGGRLTIESTLGIGASFTAHLPLIDTAPQRDALSH